MNRLTYISLFSGAGVGCYGFYKEGFLCVATNELLEKRLKIQKYNAKCALKSGYILGDISKKEVADKIYEQLRQNGVTDLDVLIATPPCQGMSSINHKKRDERKRNSLVVESIKMVADIEPKFFVFENVRAFLNTLCTDSDGVDRPIKEAIERNLGGAYNILAKVVNFKEYGAHSSRTRTLVIGVRKDLTNITPYDLFPAKQEPKVLRELIGDLPPLKVMGEIDPNDIFHSYRSFDKKMLPWIESLKEGESAFENQDPKRRPHRVLNGRIVFNKNKNGDKYKRWYWDRVGPCVHTRNDILASQNTIHPRDNRVFSITELMRMMTIPKEFRWSDRSLGELNALCDQKKREFLKKEEINIRQCIGEAVPTRIFEQIARNIKHYLSKKKLSVRDVNDLISRWDLKDTQNLKKFLKENGQNFELSELFMIAELANTQRIKHKAYFTREDIVFNIVHQLPDFKNKKSIRILEPSVGIGNFLPLLFKKYEHIDEVVLDVIDINGDSLEILKILLEKVDIPANFTINPIQSDFLLWKERGVYDLVIGNPPFGKVPKNLLKEYRSLLTPYNGDTGNIFALFIEKALKISQYLSFIVPKSLLGAPEFDKTRELLEKQNILVLTDFGEKAFHGIKIETISFLLRTNQKERAQRVKIQSYITKDIRYKPKEYIFDKAFPYWLIYRDEFFDSVAEKMEFDVFGVFRDRQITKKVTKPLGKYRVLKSRNIADGKIVNIPGYDAYIDDIKSFAVSRFLNKDNIVLVPNLTYYPRAAFLPKSAIADGSVALLIPKKDVTISKGDVSYFASEEFRQFYRIARNKGTRSLNIDRNSVWFFGIKKRLKSESYIR